jgi:hypothetical protein
MKALINILRHFLILFCTIAYFGSYLFHFRGNNGLVMFLNFFFALLNEIDLALMILWHAMIFAIGAITLPTPKP